MKVILFSIFAFLFVPALHAGMILEDHFTTPTMPGRDLAAHRGVWNVQDGVATCVQDDELFKKNTNHGPVIWYNLSFTDGTVRFSCRPEKSKTFVFTLNNTNGHVFRFVQSETALSFRAWPEPEKPVTLNQNSTGLTDGQWTPVELIFKGDQCTVSVGIFKQTLQNPAIAFPKTRLGLGFSFGTLSVKDVTIEN